MSALKYPKVDILKLYSGSSSVYEMSTVKRNPKDATYDCSVSHNALASHKAWNKWLARCLKNHDLSELLKTRYGLQVGMSDLVKSKMNSPMINEMFCRWISSIEKTARTIIKEKHRLTVVKSSSPIELINLKREIENEFAKFLIDSSY